ncbi:MAG TPA: spore coat protein [Symbiobacteriaceae bacterium]|nr:spore coat protein [Symbiobacteriaceae bacterium]
MPTQRDIAAATTVNNLLKQCATSTALSACECSSPDLRSTFAEISQTAIRRQEQLSALMMQRGWYVPPVADEATVNALRPQLEIAMGATAIGGTLTGGTMTTGTVSGQTLAGITAPRIM